MHSNNLAVVRIVLAMVVTGIITILVVATLANTDYALRDVALGATTIGVVLYQGLNVSMTRSLQGDD